MPQNTESGIIVYTGISDGMITVCAYIEGVKTEDTVKIEETQDEKNALSLLFYRVLSKATGDTYPWGILYGVRPARFYHSLADKFSPDYAQKVLKDKFLVSDGKISLVSAVAESENKIIPLSGRNSFSLYVSIPFCLQGALTALSFHTVLSVRLHCLMIMLNCLKKNLRKRGAMLKNSV